MELALETLEKKLIELGKITREEINEEKKKGRFWRKESKVFKRFKKAVEDDYTQFFPKRPCKMAFPEYAQRLLKNGGSQDFRTKKEETRACRRNPVDYREEILREDLEVSQSFYVKSSQETIVKGKGKNNPRLSAPTRLNYLVRMVSGETISGIIKSSKHDFEKFNVFKDDDEEVRSPAAQATLYRLRGSTVVATHLQVEDFVERSKRLTIATDGTTSKANRECLCIVFYNENRDKIAYEICEIFGKKAEEVSTAIIEAINILPFAEIIWSKVDSVLSDTARNQLSANEKIEEYIRGSFDDQTVNVAQIWCVLHTISNLDKYGRDKLSQIALEVLTHLKILFGSSNSSGAHREDIKKRFSREKNKLFPSRRKNEQPFTTDVGSRIGAARQNSESLLVFWEPVKKTLEAYPNNKRAVDLLKLMEHRSEVILEVSFPTLIWATFCTPIIKVAEQKFTIVGEVLAEMDRCLTKLDEILQSSEPYDLLVSVATENRDDSEYFRLLKKEASTPRNADLRQRLNETTVKSLQNVKVKLAKDTEHMKSLRLEGKYETSNRFCESIFGVLKKKETSSTAGDLLSVVDDTISSKNNLGEFLKMLSKTKTEELMAKIDDPEYLQSIQRKRQQARESLFKMREDIKKKEQEDAMAKEERKRKREERKSELTPVRKVLRSRNN